MGSWGIRVSGEEPSFFVAFTWLPLHCSPRRRLRGKKKRREGYVNIECQILSHMKIRNNQRTNPCVCNMNPVDFFKCFWVWVTLVWSSLTCSHADPHFLWSLTLTNLSLPPSRRCEEPGEFSPGRERPGAGQRSAAGLRHVQLPTANGQVWPAAPPATRDTSHQPASRRIPILQTPERRRALQQPAHWNAARQKSLGGDFPTRSAAVQFCSSPETPNNAFTKTKPPAHTWLCGDLEDGEQSLYRAFFFLWFKLQLEVNEHVHRDS